MVAGFCNTNGFGTFLALFILALTFRVLKVTPKTPWIWKLDCSGYLLMHRYMKIAHIYWSWEWSELDHFFVHPILPKHRSEPFFVFNRIFFIFHMEYLEDVYYNLEEPIFDIRLAISVATAQSGALLVFFDFC
jgi:hypothetical protein